MAKFTLDDLKKTVEEKYAPTIIDMGEAGDLVLQPSLRLPDDKLAEFSACQRQFNSIQRSEPKYYQADGITEREPTDEEAEAFEAEQLKIRPRMIELMKEMVRIPATSLEQAEKFFAVIGDDLPSYIVTMEKYSESTQLGEASASSSS